MLTISKYVLPVGKTVVLAYWLWFAKAIWADSTSPFDAVIAATGPLVASLHLVQLVFFTRRLNPSDKFWREAVQVLLFGAFHVLSYAMRHKTVAGKQAALRVYR